MISLLSASLLAGLAVGVVPLIVHLLSRRRARRVRFAPIELLLRSQKRTARSVRLRQFLLLLTRTLLLLAIAAALLRPLLENEQQARATTAPAVVVIALDASASMQARTDGRTSFDEAVRQARDVITTLADDVRTGLVVCENEPRDVVVPSFDRGAVLNALQALQPTAAYADAGLCVSRAGALAMSVGDDVVGERRVVLVSDLAAHGFPRGAASAAAAGLAVVVRKVGDDEAPPNHGITDVRAVPVSQGLAITFGAVRFGGPASAEVIADLTLGASAATGGTRGPRLSLPLQNNGARLERTFSASVDGELTQASVTLADDAFALDNTVTLPFEARPKLKVIVVDGEPDAVPFADEVYYLTQALSSSRSGGGASMLDVTVLPPDKLDAAALAGIDVIVLANVARLDDAAAAALTSHVNAGAGLFITMGDQVDPDAYNKNLASLLPATLRGTKQQVLLDDAAVADVLGLSRFQTEHPIFVAFAGVTGDALPGLTRVRTKATMLVEPSPDAKERQTLMRFTNDAPALMERAVGPRGRVLLLTTSVDREWTDLPIRPGYLPLMEQIVLYLGRALDHGRPRTIRAFEPREIVFPSGSERIVVTRPDGRLVSLDVKSIDGDRVRFTDTGAVGLYDVNAFVGDDKRPLLAERFTALVDIRELDLRRVDDAALKEALPEGAVVRRDQGDDNGTPLWPALMLLALALVLGEALLVNRGDRAP